MMYASHSAPLNAAVARGSRDQASDARTAMSSEPSNLQGAHTARSGTQPDSVLQTAWSLLKLRQPGAAKAVLLPEIARDPGSPDLLMALGHAFRIEGKREAAFRIFRNVQSRSPDHFRATFEMAQELRALRRLDEARLAYGRVLAVVPDHADAMLSLGVIARLQNDRSTAIAHFERALRHHSDHEATQLELAAEYLHRRQLPPAEALFLGLFRAGRAVAQASRGLQRVPVIVGHSPHA